MKAKTLSSPLGFRCETPDQIRERVLANGLSHVELNTINAADLPEIKQLVAKHSLTVGVHFIIHNVRKRGKALLSCLLEVLLSPP